MNLLIKQNLLGKNCKYRHALPPGFVLKSKAQKKAEAEEEDQITIEEFLETEVIHPAKCYPLC